MKKIDYELFDEQVDRFLRHQMIAEEEMDFKAQLVENDALCRRAHNIALSIKEMNTIQQKRDTALIDAIKGLVERQFRDIAQICAKVVQFIPLPPKRPVQFGKPAACMDLDSHISFSKRVDDETVFFELEDDRISCNKDISGHISLCKGAFFCDYKDREQRLDELFYNVEVGRDLDSAIDSLKICYKKAEDGDPEFEHSIDNIAWHLTFAYLKMREKEKPLLLLEDILKRNEDSPEIVEVVHKLMNNIDSL